MKNLIFCLLFLSMPIHSFSQTKADYEKMMKEFVGYYNNNQPEKINMMFDVNRNFYKKESIAWLKDKYGKIVSFQYANPVPIDIDPNNITLFKVVGEKQTFMMAFSLDEKLKFGTHRFGTSSPYVDSIKATMK